MSLENETKPLILLGDPDPFTATALSAQIRSWGYLVEVVGDGQEALARLNAPPHPAVALLASDLSNTSGIDVVREWNSRLHESPLWTMILSDSASMEQVVMAKDAGVDDFLVKPVTEMELHLRLKTAERVHALHRDLHNSISAMRLSSSHDSLTGFWSREYMLGMLFQETDRVQRMRTPLCFMLVEIDHFSEVDLLHGSTGAEQVLRQLVERFRRHLRSYDLIGRYGENKFLIALPGCNSENAVAFGGRLRRMIFQPQFDLGVVDSLKLTGSFGVAQSKGRSPLVVLRETENALRQAKLAGGDRLVCFGGASVSPVAAAPEYAKSGRNEESRDSQTMQNP